MKIYTMKELATRCNFIVTTPFDAEKLTAVYNRYIYDIEQGNSGAFGNACEKLSRRHASRKMTVSKQGVNDITVKIDGKLTPVESKTNGGRIDGITEKYIVYTLSVHNSIADVNITPRIMLTESFIDKLYELNAIKTTRHNGVPDGIAIQPSNRKLWAWLETQLEFDATWDYFSSDFE